MQQGEKRGRSWLALFSLALIAPSVLFGAGCATTPAASSTSTGREWTLMVLGASDAWGVGLGNPTQQNWPSELAEDLDRPVHLINLGIPGETLRQAQRQELPIALDTRPDVVVIWLAVNDVIAQVPQSTYSIELRQTLAAFARQTPHAQVFVGNLPDLTRIPFFADNDVGTLRSRVLAWNNAIAQICAATGATLVDIYQTWNQLGSQQDYIGPDGLHPSQRGADELAHIFSAAILLSGAQNGSQY
jgi:lysophospholipase L1-like esterase